MASVLLQCFVRKAPSGETNKKKLQEDVLWQHFYGLTFHKAKMF